MPQVDIFPIDAAQVFADLVHNQLGVRVRMRGDTIACDFNEKPPVIYLPSLEFAKEEDVNALYGFALHEAGHVKHTRFASVEEIRDYLLKGVHNFFEDEFIERKLRRDFPGASEMLSFSNAKGYELAVKGKDGRTLFQATRESYLDNPKAILARLSRMALAPHAGDISKAGLSLDDPDLIAKVAARREIVAPLVEMIGPGLVRRCVEERKGVILDEEADMIAEACGCPDALTDALARTQLWGSREEMERRGVKGHSDDEKVMEFLGKRLEVTRFLWLWSYSWRNGPDKDLRRQFEEHPWRATLDAVNAESTRSTDHAIEKAVAFCKALGIESILPDDNRPVDRARALVSDAADKDKLANMARKELRLIIRERDAVAREKVEASMEASALLEAQDEHASACEAKRECSKKLAKARIKLKKAKDALKTVRDRLAKNRRSLREERKRLSDIRRDADAAKGRGDADEAARQDAAAEVSQTRVESMLTRTSADEALLERREEAVEMQEMFEHDALADSSAARMWELDSLNSKTEAEKKLEEEKERIGDSVKDAYREQAAPAEKAVADAEAEYKKAEDAANAVLIPMRDKDYETEAPIAPGILGEIIREAIERVRNTSVKDELGSAVMQTVKGEAPSEVNAARMYSPFDRSADMVDEIQETPEGREDYEIARLEYKEIIDETTERLKKLYSPERNRVKVNVTEGRLDPRKAYKIGLAMNGTPQDLSRVWKDIQTRKDPRVAVSMLIDCSGSMTGPNLKLARAASCALSEVMRSLYIPHEIIGHTTGTNLKDVGLRDQAEIELASKEHSRILPFQGYVFKRFEDNNPPASVFTDVKMNENLDGEAVMWALRRLSVRREKTKIAIVICDGLPNAAFSKTEELERHLYGIAKRAEAKENEGVHLCAIGIGIENVRQYYRNADVINEIADLPRAVLTIVENVIAKTGMA